MSYLLIVLIPVANLISMKFSTKRAFNPAGFTFYLVLIIIKSSSSLLLVLLFLICYVFFNFGAETLQLDFDSERAFN